MDLQAKRGEARILRRLPVEQRQLLLLMLVQDCCK